MQNTAILNKNSFIDKVNTLFGLIARGEIEEATRFFGLNLRPSLEWVAYPVFSDRKRRNEGRTSLNLESEKAALAAMDNCPKLQDAVDRFSIGMIVAKFNRHQNNGKPNFPKLSRAELKDFALEALLGEKRNRRKEVRVSDATTGEDAKRSSSKNRPAPETPPEFREVENKVFLHTVIRLAGLSKEDLSIILLVMDEGLSPGVIAERLSIPRERVYRRLAIILRTLGAVAIAHGLSPFGDNAPVEIPPIPPNRRRRAAA